MYAVVQIGSRILRSAWGTKRSVRPFFCACTYGAAAAVVAIAAVPARNVRRLSVMGVLPVGDWRGDGGTPPCGVQADARRRWHRHCSIWRGREGRAMQTVAGTFATRADAERAAAQLEAVGVSRDRITLLSPGADPRRVVPTDDGERPGTGAAIGAVVGVGAGAFARDELLFRRGFEAALSPNARARTWEEALPDLRTRHADVVDSPAFRHGWERGQDYNREFGFGTGLRKSA